MKKILLFLIPFACIGLIILTISIFGIISYMENNPSPELLTNPAYNK